MLKNMYDMQEFKSCPTCYVIMFLSRLIIVYLHESLMTALTKFSLVVRVGSGLGLAVITLFP